MFRKSGNRYFDLSSIAALGLVTLLLISMPGGCGDSDDSDDEEGVETEAVAEPTAPPMMEIVDPEPGDLQTASEEPEDADIPADEGDAEEGEPEQDSDADAEEAHSGVYVVQEGDTLYGIAVNHNVSMEALMAANGMDDPNSLQIGQELQIPE
jgi:cell envelope opacity-associated protein A